MKMRMVLRKAFNPQEPRNAQGEWAQLPGLEEAADSEATIHNAVQVLARTGNSTIEAIVKRSGLSVREAMSTLDHMVRAGKIIRDGRIYRLGAKLGHSAGELKMTQPVQGGFDFGKSLRLVLKSHVRTYTRRVGNRLVIVREHDDSRTRKPDEAPAPIHTRAFKSWFGEWESVGPDCSRVRQPNGEPAETYPVEPTKSRVMGPEGRPLVVYHGTARGGFRSFDPEKTDLDALMGPGFYFTEDKALGESYERKGADTHNLQMPRLRAVAVLKERARAKFADEPHQLRRAERMAEDVGTGFVGVQSFEALGLKADDIYANTGTGQLFSVFLNIRKPFDADEDRIAWKQIPGMYQEDLAKRGERRRPDYVTWQQLSDRLGPRVANAVVRSAGYDGITHIGGQIMGSGDHRVWIAFHPTQIKATTNAGTFDPHNPDIYKGQVCSFFAVSR